MLQTSAEASYDSFVEVFPEQECRWAVFDFEYDAPDGGKRNKLVFFSWYVTYSSCWSPFVFTIRVSC